MGAPNKKQKREAKKRERERRRREYAGTFPNDLRIIANPPGQLRMSEVLEEFAAPYIEDASTEEELRALFGMATVAWNASMLPDEACASAFAKLDQTFPIASRAVARNLLEKLILRKRTHFAHITRGIVSFELTTTPEGFHISVISTLG